jgi:hypothetical protein
MAVLAFPELVVPADRLEGAHMGVDPVRQRLRPDRLGEGEARRAQYRDEDLRMRISPVSRSMTRATSSS